MERSKEFKIKLTKFKQNYEKDAPFNWTDEINEKVIDKAYENIDNLRDTITNLTEEANQLNDLEELFNLQKSVFNEIGYCQSKLNILKELWDIAS